jgi:hypothetical protein
MATLRKRKADPESEADSTPNRKSTRVKTIQTANVIASPAPTVDEDIDDAPAPLVPGKDPDFGKSTAVKVFYEGKPNRNGTTNWVETPPKQLKVSVTKANNRFAINIFKVKDHSQPTINGNTPLKIQSVQVQSGILVKALKDIVKDEGMYLETTETAKFSEPFKPLFFCYDKILAMQKKKHQDKLLTEHSALLVKVMDELFRGFMAHLKHLRSSGLITYKLAWTYFPKDGMLFCGTSDSERVCRIVSTAYQGGQSPHLLINCEEIEFDGETFAWQPAKLRIPMFEGNLPVTDLPSYPLSFHEDAEGVTQRLIARGKKILGYQELTYSEYSGIGLHPTQCGMQRHNVRPKSTVPATH